MKNTIVNSETGEINLKAGFVYAPYVPLNLEPIYEWGTGDKPLMKVKEWLAKKKLMSTYSVKEINKKFYGNINI